MNKKTLLSLMMLCFAFFGVARAQEEQCPTPQNVVVTNITEIEATVTWSDYNDVYQVQVGSPSDIINTLLNENFDNGFPNGWNNDSSYPWTIIDGHIQSGNAGVSNSTSSISLSIYLDSDGTVQFDAECKGEGAYTVYDKCIFSIDDEQQFSYGAGISGWNHYSFDVTAGEHTLTWSYSKDTSMNPDGDYFAVDNVIIGIDEIVWGASIDVQNPPYTLTGLDPTTEYYVHVRGICGPNQTEPYYTDWSESKKFKTLGNYTITASASPANGGTVTGGGVYYSGDTCTLTATENLGYYLYNWTKDGEQVGNYYDSTYTFVVTENANIVAHFEPLEFYPWFTSIPEEGGYCYYLIGGESSQSVHFGDTITIHAVPNENFTFYKWTLWGGDEYGGYDYMDFSTSPNDTITFDESFLNNGGDGEVGFIANFVESVDDCIRPVDFSITEVGPTLAKFGWTELGTSEAWMMYYRPAYTPAYVPYDSLEIYQNPYTLIGLQPNTSYEAYIIPSCGFTDGIANEYLASNTVTFTTLEACPAPFNLQVSNITHNSATVAWTGYNDEYTLSYRVATELIDPVFSEGFEGGVIPQGWSNQGDASWEVGVGGSEYDTISPHSGNYTAQITHNNSQEQTYFVTPSMNLGGQNDLVLSFWYINKSWGDDIDELGVYYRIGSEGAQGAWQPLWSTTEAHETWTNQVVELTELSDNYQIGFLFTDHYGYGVGLDDIVIAHEQISEWITLSNATNPMELTGLTPSTNYEVRVMGSCDETQTGWSNSALFTTTEANTVTIMVSANPTDAGVVTGGGEFNVGSTCTLNATASEGYTFQSWTLNDSVVSNNASYSFTVMEAATYVANFQINSYLLTINYKYEDGTPAATTHTENVNYNVDYSVASPTITGYTPDLAVVTGTMGTQNVTVDVTYSINSYQITATANPSVGGTVTGGGTYNHFDEVTLTAIANEGYTFIGWSDGIQEAQRTITVTGPAEYVANFQLNSYQITATAYPSVGGTVTGGGTYNHFETCTLTATPNEYYNFTNWTKNGQVVSTNATYSFTVTDGGTYIANFTRVNHEITATANPAESGIVSGAGSYAHGSTCTLTATANTGYAFSSWTKNGTVVSSSPSYSFTVTEDAAYVANFTPIMYTITVSADPSIGGTAYGNGTYLYNENCTVSAISNAGYTFTNWTKNGTVVSTDATYTFTVTENANLVAHFTQDHYTVTVSVDPQEAGTASGGGSFTYGETCTLTATPNTGYAFVNWTKNGTVVSSNANYSFTVTSDGSYVAHFSVARYTLTVLAEPAEGGTVHGGGNYDYGQIATLRAFANNGYTFVNWTKDGVVVSSNAIYSVSVREDAVYVANFLADTFEIKANTDPDNSGDIEGIGMYNYGEICTLTVIPHDEYEFINWTLNGEVVSEEQSFSFVVTESRDYVAHLQHVEGVIEQGGITISLFPNPAKNKLTVEASEPVNMLEIYNINGALVYRQNDCSDKIEINVQSYAIGTYMIRLTTDSSVEIRRFVKE